MVSTQDPANSQALFNIKDSNKVRKHKALRYLCIMHMSHTSLPIVQEERERRVLVRKFKFEEPRREQIDELKVCFALKGNCFEVFTFAFCYIPVVESSSCVLLYCSFFLVTIFVQNK